MKQTSNTMKGLFKPLHPEKYKGNAHNIIYRSSWELKCMRDFDSNRNVIEWQSEERAIPYRSPIDRSLRRYYPDFIIKIKAKDGSTRVIMIEVKPNSQTKMPVKTPRKKQQTYIKESFTYATNQAKWKAAEQFCIKRGWKFKVLTENEIFGANYFSGF